jgi:Fic family protein
LDARADIDGETHLRLAMRVACCAFVYFLGIHPYMNGNGHAGRLLLWAILVKFGYIPRRWTVDMRPPDPQYSDGIKRHRNGNFDMLENSILACLEP